MWRDSFNEIRLHPGRFIATLLAITISVAFLAAISVFVNTEHVAQARNNSLAISTSDLVVEVDYEALVVPGKEDEPFEPDPAKNLKTLRAVPGVEKVYPVPFRTLTMLTHGDESAFITFYATPSEEFRWAKLKQGKYPAAASEIALSSDALKRLGAKVGDTIEAGDGQGKVTVVGETDDPRSAFAATGYVFVPETDVYTDRYGVKVAPGADVASVMNRIKTETKGFKAETAAAVQQQALDNLTGEFDAFKGILQAFAAIAVVVGAITIANTFTILVTQRRRQIALLRAVGASTMQVSLRLVLESLMLGALGSLGGLILGTLIGWAGAAYTGSLYWGLQLKGSELVTAFITGVVATLLAATLPSLRAAAVKPLEALQVVPTAAQAKRYSIIRAVICVILFAAGVGLVVLSYNSDDALVWAIFAGAVLSLAVLLGAPFYIPAILNLLSKVFGRRPTARLSLLNAARNPARASSTATALMLAIGLIATLQVSLATVRTTGMAYIDENYPIDIAAEFSEGVPNQALAELKALPGIERMVVVETKLIELGGESRQIRDGEKPERSMGFKPKWSNPDVILVPEWVATAKTIQVGNRTITLKPSDNPPYPLVAATSTFDALPGKATETTVWLKMKDRSSVSTLNQVMRITERHHGYLGESGAQMASALEQILNILLAVLSALLGVAVMIALVGVGNTLSLSVLERQRESALLRALGMQRSQLRLSLLIEAVALVAVGAVIGMAAGLFFGWLGVTSVMRMMPAESRPDLHFAIDPLWTGVLIGICLLAACLASILPGRRAANVAPAEALAAD